MKRIESYGVRVDNEGNTVYFIPATGFTSFSWAKVRDRLTTLRPGVVVPQEAPKPTADKNQKDSNK